MIIHISNHPVTTLRSVKPMVDYLLDKGLHVDLWTDPIPFKMSVSINPIASLYRLIQCYLAFKSIKPKMVHTHTSRFSLIPLLAAKMAKVPLRIYHNHGLPYLGHRGLVRFVLKTIEKINIFSSTHILLVSRSNLECVKKDELAHDKPTAILNYGSAAGIKIEEFAHNNQKKSSDKNQFVVAYIGRPYKRKGFHLMLKAWEESGLGKDGDKLLVAGCTMDDCKKVLGHTPEGVSAYGFIDDITSVIRDSNAVALPSYHEGFPNIFLEGAVFEKILIGTDIPGITCAIIDQSTGILIPAQDQKALKDLLIEIKNNPEKFQIYGINARKRVEEKFQQKDVLESLYQFYQKVLS